jgi:hypothetical protein
MMRWDVEELEERVAELGKKIQLKRRQLDKNGVLQGEERRRAIDLQVEQTRVSKLLAARDEGAGHPDREAALAAEVEALRLWVGRWMAGIDRGF